MSLVNVQLHLFVRFVKLAGLAARLQGAHRLLKDLHHLETTLAFDVELDAPVGRNGNFKFAFGHGF
jgi:hypothetical protein